jgi:hypothetical protein
LTNPQPHNQGTLLCDIFCVFFVVLKIRHDGDYCNNGRVKYLTPNTACTASRNAPSSSSKCFLLRLCTNRKHQEFHLTISTRSTQRQANHTRTNREAISSSSSASGGAGAGAFDTGADVGAESSVQLPAARRRDGLGATQHDTSRKGISQ